MAATNMTRLSRLATNLIAAPSCERSVLARQNTPTPSADAANERASGVPASSNAASRIMVPRDGPARPGPRTDELRRRRLLAVPAPLVRNLHGLLARDARASRRRHRAVGERVQQLPPPLPRADRRGQARRGGGGRLGACTDCRRFWAKYRAGGLSAAEIQEIEGNLATTAGTCAVMGTASTMAALAETLGMALPGTAAIPAVHADRLRAAEASGRQAVALATAGLRPSRIMTAKAIENALRVLLAIGGSTNAIIHLTAIAGRVGVPVSLTRLNELSDSTPVLVDLKPTGQHYMSDLHAAGGVGAVLRELKPLLHLDCLTVSGETLGARLAAEPGWVDRAVVRPLDDPYQKQGGLVALFGSLAPGGAILKRSAADPALFERDGRAVVFSSLDDLAARIDAADLDVAPDDVLVLQNAGPKSGYAMPEAGYLPIPARLARAGVKDMVRISDARMSGTAYGTIVLHVSPESAIGGPLALARNGDRIRLSVKERKIDVVVDEAELGRRRAAWRAPTTPPGRGYAKLYMQSVLQAEHGCDFDFLRQQEPTA